MDWNDPTLQAWINPQYLSPNNIYNIRESVLAKPHIRYTVLDNFFNANKLSQLIARHADLEFSEINDKFTHDGTPLPYDSAVKFANKSDVGSDLFFSAAWHAYCAHITATNIQGPYQTDIKLRWHRPDADGFWIHTDEVGRDVVAICYFNQGWTHVDGGLLQLWLVDECLGGHPYVVESPTGRLDFLASHKRIRTRTPGGGFPDKQVHDLILVDQIVPAYNRLFLCNFKFSSAYHSVSPSRGKARTGFVQWIRGK